MSINANYIMKGQEQVTLASVYEALEEKAHLVGPTSFGPIITRTRDGLISIRAIDKRVAKLELAQQIGISLLAFGIISAIILSPILQRSRIGITLVSLSTITGMVTYTLSTLKKREHLRKNVKKEQVEDILCKMKEAAIAQQKAVKKAYRLKDLNKLANKIN